MRTIEGKRLKGRLLRGALCEIFGAVVIRGVTLDEHSTEYPFTRQVQCFAGRSDENNRLWTWEGHIRISVGLRRALLGL